MTFNKPEDVGFGLAQLAIDLALMMAVYNLMNGWESACVYAFTRMVTTVLWPKGLIAKETNQ